MNCMLHECNLSVSCRRSFIIKEQSYKQLVTKLVHNTEGKTIHPVQARHVVKVELPQFADKTQQHAHEFLMAILPALQLSRYQGSVSSALQFKVVNTSLSRKSLAVLRFQCQRRYSKIRKLFR